MDNFEQIVKALTVGSGLFIANEIFELVEINKKSVFQLLGIAALGTIIGIAIICFEQLGFIDTNLYKDIGIAVRIIILGSIAINIFVNKQIINRILLFTSWGLFSSIVIPSFWTNII